jgi:hypothetical protein
MTEPNGHGVQRHPLRVPAAGVMSEVVEVRSSRGSRPQGRLEPRWQRPRDHRGQRFLDVALTWVHNARMATRAPRDIAEAIRRYDEDVQQLALELRGIVHDELTPCHEYMLDMKSRVVLLYSRTDKVIADGLCHLGLNARHVTLAFMNGVEMKNTGDLLRGAGKVMRHLRISSREDLRRPELREFLRQQRKLAGMPRKKPGAPIDITRKLKPGSTSSARTRPTPWPKKLF